MFFYPIRPYQKQGISAQDFDKTTSKKRRIPFLALGSSSLDRQSIKILIADIAGLLLI
jgi:hypothetical protein